MSGIDIEAYEDEWEDHAAIPARGPGTPSPSGDQHPVGRVIGTHKGWVDVELEGMRLEAVYGGSMQGEPVAVGDRVRVRRAEHDTDTPRVVERLARRTTLLRTADDAIDEERVVVANADQALAVLTCETLEMQARFADRVLVAASAGGLAGGIVVNKVDLLDDHPDWSRQLDDLEARYRTVGYPVLRTSAVGPSGLGELVEQLTGGGEELAGEGRDPDREATGNDHDDQHAEPGTGRRWTVMSGHSGVGKSSLLNRLIPDADQRVRETGRYGGRHTTVSPRAIRLPDRAGKDQQGGAWVVDTPGVRSFGLAMIDPDELDGHFPEMADVVCELPGCRHDGEPGCAVPDLLGGQVSHERYDSYRRFLHVLGGDEQTEAGARR